MIASDATLINSFPAERLLFSQSNFQSQPAELPSRGTFLSQGAAVGALLAFLWPVIGMLSQPKNGYNYLLVGYLPWFLGAGMLFGLCKATVLWAATYAVGHRIHPIIRAMLGPAILIAVVSSYAFLVSEPSLYHKEVSTGDYMSAIGLYAGCGVVLGLVIGSRIRPIFELVRGTEPEQWPVMNALTGLALRPIVIFGLMMSILILILSTQRDFNQTEFTMSLIAVLHFILAVAILFARIPFWLLLPLALITNFPVVAFITDFLNSYDVFWRIFTSSYLALWLSFLLCRVKVPPVALAWFKGELRYYFG